ncbi:MAG: efflux RND transporter periplasmic adaptor subunit [Brevinematales bacterium]|jgi:HlyD family secretion protein
MKTKAIIPIAGVIIVLLAATLYFEVFRNISNNVRTFEGSGTIEATEIEISSTISGRIAELPVDEGVEVKRNQLLVKLVHDELAAERNSAAASFENADINLKRVSSLYSSGSASKKEFDDAQAFYRVSKAALEQITANIENAVILAPIDGTVLVKNLEIGETAFPGSAILTMADLRHLYIKIYVDEKKLGLVKLGMKAAVHVDSYPGRDFRGVVSTISEEAEFTPKTIETRDERVKLMFAVKINLDNPDEALKPGMPADAVIYLDGAH